MKSNEEFIAGIYAKAEQRKNFMTVEPTNVVKINAFQRKLKRYITYAAGVAACLICGVVMTKGIQKEGVPNPKMARTMDSNSIGVEGVLDYVRCKILSAEETEGIYHIQVDMYHTNQESQYATLLVISDMVTGWLEVGNEIVVRLYEADENNNFTIAPDSEIFSYTGMEDGVKVYTSLSNLKIKETDLLN